MSSSQPRKFTSPRGVADLLPDEWPYWRYVRDVAEQTCTLFGYRRIETPVFESAGVYLRTSGAGTDIVEKEVYLFEDRGGDELALRPEGTAGVVRSYLEHGMANEPQPVRLYYLAPNFRYDRPQAGRYRQHTQVGAEAIGEADPLVDAEIIHLLWSFYGNLGLSGLTLKLNSIGDAACRPAYIDALRDYYRPRLAEVCEDDRVRFDKNPLRLLDCKTPSCQPIIAGAPRLKDYLCEACQQHFDRLQSYLSQLKIGYEVDDLLVRGLDYYTRTAFEVQPAREKGQSAIGGGGRYDGLAEVLGGPPTPGIGFGTGVERIILNLKEQGVALGVAEGPALFIAHLTPEATAAALVLANAVRAAGASAMLGSAGRSLKSQMRQADARGARYVAIIGAQEVAAGEATLRDLADHSEQKIPLADVPGLIVT